MCEITVEKIHGAISSHQELLSSYYLVDPAEQVALLGSKNTQPVFQEMTNLLGEVRPTYLKTETTLLNRM